MHRSSLRIGGCRSLTCQQVRRCVAQSGLRERSHKAINGQEQRDGSARSCRPGHGSEQEDKEESDHDGHPEPPQFEVRGHPGAVYGKPSNDLFPKPDLPREEPAIVTFVSAPG
jgi:hypothetical protein